ncbi:MAG: ABC transporter ATP-binding protein [Clostridia bacterium]|nr:ABC transporter ATP-binding protein [Clostridia bacterium]
MAEDNAKVNAVSGKNGEVLLSVSSLSQSFEGGKEDVKALCGVSFEIMRGEIFGLVGESGSGKTTTGRIITGIYQPDGGDVIFEGERIRAGTKAIKDKIKLLRARARRNIARLRLYSARHVRDIPQIAKNIDYVKNDLRKRLKKLSDELVAAEDVSRKYRKKAHPDIRMVFQDPSASLNPRMTVGESIREALIAEGVKDSELIRQRVSEVLLSVGLPKSAASRYPTELSGGQRQRVGIARAIITEPKLLIADEPVSALDVSVGAQVINLILDLAAKMSLSVLLVAHDLSLVRHVCDRVGVMYKGYLVELAPAGELFENPKHPYTKALISAIPIPDPIIAKNSTRVEFSAEQDELSGEFCDIGGGHFVLLSRCVRWSDDG